MLSGFTHMSIAIVALLVEATHDMDMVIPILVSIGFATLTNKLLGGDNFDETLIKLKKVPLLHPELKLDSKTKNVGDVMELFSRDTPQLKTEDTKLTDIIKLLDLHPSLSHFVVTASDDDAAEANPSSSLVNGSAGLSGSAGACEVQMTKGVVDDGVADSSTGRVGSEREDEGSGDHDAGDHVDSPDYVDFPDKYRSADDFSMLKTDLAGSLYAPPDSQHGSSPWCGNTGDDRSDGEQGALALDQGVLPGRDPPGGRGSQETEKSFFPDDHLQAPQDAPGTGCNRAEPASRALIAPVISMEGIHSLAVPPSTTQERGGHLTIDVDAASSSACSTCDRPRTRTSRNTLYREQSYYNNLGPKVEVVGLITRQRLEKVLSVHQGRLYAGTRMQRLSQADLGNSESGDESLVLEEEDDFLEIHQRQSLVHRSQSDRPGDVAPGFLLRSLDSEDFNSIQPRLQCVESSDEMVPGFRSCSMSESSVFQRTLMLWKSRIRGEHVSPCGKGSSQNAPSSGRLASYFSSPSRGRSINLTFGGSSSSSCTTVQEEEVDIPEQDGGQESRHVVFVGQSCFAPSAGAGVDSQYQQQGAGQLYGASEGRPPSSYRSWRTMIFGTTSMSDVLKDRGKQHYSDDQSRNFSSCHHEEGQDGMIPSGVDHDRTPRARSASRRELDDQAGIA
ncbi:unnamed protein product, partial [Amoebophrya sp. A25]|eukprot:GSA25T00002920001.1